MTKISKTTTPLADNAMLYHNDLENKNPKIQYWVVIEEINPNLPQSKLFRTRLSASNKQEAEDTIHQFKTTMPKEVLNSVNIRIEKA